LGLNRAFTKRVSTFKEPIRKFISFSGKHSGELVQETTYNSECDFYFASNETPFKKLEY
jgi:hypothetical protein